MKKQIASKSWEEKSSRTEKRYFLNRKENCSKNDSILQEYMVKKKKKNNNPLKNLYIWLENIKSK